MQKLFITALFTLIFFTNTVANEVCEKEKKYSQAWYYNNCDGNILQSTDQKPIESHLKDNPKVGYPYNSDEIPADANPNYKILTHYLKKSIDPGQWGNLSLIHI